MYMELMHIYIHTYIHHMGYVFCCFNECMGCPETKDDELEQWEQQSMGATSILVRCLILCMLYRKTRDERCFIYLVIQKLSMAYLASLTPRLVVWEMWAKTMVAGTTYGLMAIQLLTYSFCFFFAVLGIRGTASIPGHLDLFNRC